MIWKPNLTVATVVEHEGRFLFIEEMAGSEVVINQPAGHVERNESLIAAVRRETLEETAYHFAPEALVGIYHWHAADKDITYLRFTYTGRLSGHDAGRKLDRGILRALWLTPDELAAQSARHRSPLVARCVEDYLVGKRYPLDLVTALSVS